MLPKADTRASIEQLAARLPGRTQLPIIESAAGCVSVAEIASAPHVLRLAFGHIDFMADTGLLCSSGEVELAPLRFAVAMATRMHRLAPAIAGVTVDIGDERRLQDDTQRALRFGFAGKLCIHPRQIATVHAAMAPSSDQVAWAERVLTANAASFGAAVQLDGRMARCAGCAASTTLTGACASGAAFGAFEMSKSALGLSRFSLPFLRT